MQLLNIQRPTGNYEQTKARFEQIQTAARERENSTTVTRPIGRALGTSATMSAVTDGSVVQSALSVDGLFKDSGSLMNLNPKDGSMTASGTRETIVQNLDGSYDHCVIDGVTRR